MSLRFRRSLKIAPGLKLNVGKRGMSLSAGVPGARVTVGRGRTTRTVGLPGTGLSWTETQRTGGSPRGESRTTRQARTATLANLALSREATAYDGFLKIANHSPELKTSSGFDRELEVRDFEIDEYDVHVLTRWQFIKMPLQKSTKWFWLAAGLALVGMVFPQEDWRMFMGVVMLLAISGGIYQYPVLFLYGVLTSGRRRREQDEQIERLRQAHPARESERVARLVKVYGGDAGAVEDAIADTLERFSNDLGRLAHCFDLNVSFEMGAGGVVSLDTDLPEIEDVVIASHKRVLKSGEVSERAKKESELNREYAAGVLGIAFNLATRVLNVSPQLETVRVSAFTQRIDRSIGKTRDQYVYQITFDRATLSDLNLAEIDPIEALRRFTAVIAMDRSHHLAEIQLDQAG